MRFGLRVKEARLERNLSLHDLALKAGVSRTMLYAIEKEKKIPTLLIAIKISDALEINLSALIDRPAKQKVTVIRRAERTIINNQKTSITLELLSPPNNLGIEFALVKLPPNTSTGVLPPHQPNFKEYITLNSGSIRVKLSHDQMYDLNEGDSISFAADVEHEIVNLSTEEAIYYFIGYALH